jgi:hypothetical protein
MNAERRIRLWGIIVEHARGGPVTIEHVCAAALGAVGVDGAAVTVVLPASPLETMYASDLVTLELEELARTLGEGPNVDALAGDPALVADLTDEQCRARWPMFAPAAVAAGIRAVFALPVHVGVIRLGVLNLFRARPGHLDRVQLADALMFADTACALLLDAAAPARAQLDGHRPEPAGPLYPEVHQATGMITVQLGVTAATALVRLRAYAYAHDRLLRDVAREVVDRRLTFDPGPDDGPTGG